MKVKANNLKKVLLINSLLMITLTMLLLTGCSKRSIMNNYLQLTDNHHVYQEIKVDQVVKKIEKKESFYLVMGFPECPWCQALMPVLNDVAKENNVKTIYYLYLKEIRDNEESKGHEEYLKLANNYFVKAIDVNKNRLNAPTFVKVQNGVMTMYHVDTVATHIMNENGVLPQMSTEQIEELKNILKKFFS